jgi:pantothenate kinase
MHLMSDIAHLAAELFRKASGRRRFVIAIAGAPGAGKSHLAVRLHELLAEASAAIVPMDGFHYDNAVLSSRGLLPRKGAPETFDIGGFEALLRRLRTGDEDVAVPLFDRAADVARAGASVVPAATRFVIVEGNYLLLDEAPWNRLSGMFDWRIFLDVPRAELARRLVQRWVDHGMAPEAARERAFGNDMVNAGRIFDRRIEPDLVISFQD